MLSKLLGRTLGSRLSFAPPPHWRQTVSQERPLLCADDTRHRTSPTVHPSMPNPPPPVERCTDRLVLHLPRPGWQCAPDPRAMRRPICPARRSWSLAAQTVGRRRRGVAVAKARLMPIVPRASSTQASAVTRRGCLRSTGRRCSSTAGRHRASTRPWRTCRRGFRGLSGATCAISRAWTRSVDWVRFYLKQ